MKKQKSNELVPVNNLKKLESVSKLKKLNNIESIDAFEIMDIEEKLDFAKAWLSGGGCPCTNAVCPVVG